MNFSKFLGFDTETTGVDVKNDRIIQSALIERKVTRGVTRRVTEMASKSTGEENTPTDQEEILEINDTVDETYINPGIPIPPQSTAVHKITDEMIKIIGQNPEVALDKIAQKIADAIKSGMLLVIYNANYDLSILKYDLIRHSLPSIQQRIGLRDDEELYNIVDPYCIDRICDKYRKGKRRLADLIEHYSVAKMVPHGVDGELHNATVDTAFTLDVLFAQFAKYPDLSTLSAEELFNFQKEGYSKWAKERNIWAKNNGAYIVSENWITA